MIFRDRQTDRHFIIIYISSNLQMTTSPGPRERRTARPATTGLKAAPSQASRSYIAHHKLHLLGNTNYKLHLLVKTNYKLRPPALFARNKLVFSMQWVPSIFGLREEFTLNFENLFQHLLEGEQTGCKGIGVLRLLHDCLMSNISFFYVLWSVRCHFKDCSLQKRKIKEMIDLIFLALALCLNQPKTK